LEEIEQYIMTIGKAVIKDCTNHRLLELGLVPDTEVFVERRAFGIVVLSFRGSMFGIRESDFANITFH
jgi:Fe2+ transport system protein FeoA